MRKVLKPLPDYYIKYSKDIILKIKYLIRKTNGSLHDDLVLLLNNINEDEYKISNYFVLKKCTNKKTFAYELGKARQEHGFDYEDVIVKKYGIKKNRIHNGKWDINSYKTKHASIKCIKNNGDVCLGDFIRQYLIADDFYMFIGFWYGDTSNVVEDYIIKMDISRWNSYFGNVSDIYSMYDEMALISNDHTDDHKWDLFKKKYTILYGDSVIRLRFKRDHKKQKRIQCSITNKTFRDIILKDNKVTFSDFKSID